MSDGTGGGWLRTLPNDVKQAIRAEMVETRFDRDDVIFHQGDASDVLYEIISGQVIISHISIAGEEAILTVFGPGDCLGEQGLIDGGIRANTARALGETHLRRMTKAQFQRVQKVYPIVVEHLLQLISLRFRLALLMLDEVATAPLRLRLLRRLLLLTKVYGKPSERGLEITIQLSQSDLGKWVGYSRQSVNSEIQSLKNEGLISWVDGTLTVKDIESLKRALGSDDLLNFKGV